MELIRDCIIGSVRIVADTDNKKAEYALIVRNEMTGMGLGILIMRRIIDYVQSRGITEIYGDVLVENRTMVKLCRDLDLRNPASPMSPGWYVLPSDCKETEIARDSTTES